MCRHRQLKARRAERGVVLILAIIVLIAMSLAAVALMRSVTTGNKVAGNLAFQQSATASADVGVETAVSWLEQNRLGGTLFANAAVTAASGVKSGGYLASRSDPTCNECWATWWAGLDATRINELPADAAGNTVQYVIQRLCASTGDPTTNIGCQVLPKSDTNPGDGKGLDPKPANVAPQYYYRITSRVDGARGTVSFVQVVVAM